MSTGFSFGAPASTGAAAASTTTPAAPSGSLFGTATAPSSNLFGSGSAPLAFGSTGTASSASGGEQKPLFGAASAAGGSSSTTTTTAPSASSSTGFSFGSAAASGVSSGNVFGSGVSGGNVFGSPKPTPSSQSALTSSTPAPATSALQFSFGNPSTTPAGAPPSASTFAASTGGSSGPLFGAASKPADTKSSAPTFTFGKPAEAASSTAAPSSQPQTSGGLFSSAVPTSGFSFGQQAANTAASPTPFSFAPAASSAQPPLFAGFSSTQPAKPTSTKAAGSTLFGGAPSSTSSSPPASSQAPTSNIFGALSATAAASTAPKPAFSFPTSAPAFGGFGATASADARVGASTSGPPPQPQSRLKNKTMDEILTRWATDLTKYTKEFKNEADTIARWDQTIVDNSAKIDKLYVKTRTCEKQTMSVEMQLSAVENQQSELEAWLTKYESEVEEMQAKDTANAGEVGGPDAERERTYKLAEKLQERLDDMGRDLETMVDEVNAANASLHKNGKADEPITQIVRILNTHLSQLRAIDQGTAALQKKMADARKAAHGLAYLPGTNSEARAAVDDFYRSYIGRP
ncbi:hypothetical protein DV737_g792, partial [Chaetothyriales sp. CBS 132003]